MRSSDKPHLPPRALNLLLTLLLLVLLAATRPPGSDYDFGTYYAAGLLVREGVPEASFDGTAVTERYQAVRGPERRKGAFLYSPLYLLPAAALSYLPYREAELVNHALTLAALALLLYLILERTRSPGMKLLLFLAFALAHAVSIQFLYQNWSFLLVALLALAWRATERGSPLAPLWWALALHLKVIAGLFLVPLLLAGRKRLVASIVAVAILLAALALPVVGLGSYTALADRLGSVAGAGVTPFYNKLSLQATIARFLRDDPREWLAPRNPVDHPAVRYLFWLSLPAFLYLLYRLRRDETRALALTIPYLLLFTQQVWDHTQLLLFLLFLIPALARPPTVVLALLLCASVSYGPAIDQLLVQVFSGLRPPSALRGALLFYPALSVLAAVALLGRRGGSAPSEGGHTDTTDNAPE
jgi:hypothetical protein